MKKQNEGSAYELYNPHNITLKQLTKFMRTIKESTPTLFRMVIKSFYDEYRAEAVTNEVEVKCDPEILLNMKGFRDGKKR